MFKKKMAHHTRVRTLKTIILVLGSIILEHLHQSLRLPFGFQSSKQVSFAKQGVTFHKTDRFIFSRFIWD